MSKLRLHCFGLSLDGFGAGADQSLKNPLGVRGPEIMEWFFPTDFWRRMQGLGEGERGVDNQMAEKGFENLGAWILGRNMFGPVRGDWPDDSWKGWWGPEPPYHVPVFVLTHHAREPLTMKGGTEFRFVTGGIHAALEQARDAAAEASPRSVSTWAPASSTSSTSSSRPFSSGAASTSSAVSTRARWATSASRTPPAPAPRRTSCCENGVSPELPGTCRVRPNRLVTARARQVLRSPLL